MAENAKGDRPDVAKEPSTRLELLDRAVKRLDAAGRSAPRRTAEWLLVEVLGCNRADLYAHPEQPVSGPAVEEFDGMVDRRAEGVPLQHILGYASFFGLEFEVSPDVMVPRPETELVVERSLACLEGIDAPRVLDVGTGSGCIALALKHERPDAYVHGCDVSSSALAVAERNARRLEIDVSFSTADVTASSIPDAVPREIDLLVSNPPYVPDAEAQALPTVVREYDPDIALFAGEDPVWIYRALARWVRQLCVRDGRFVFETHAEYGCDVVAALREEGLRDVALETDLSDRPRMVVGRAPTSQRG